MSIVIGTTPVIAADTTLATVKLAAKASPPTPVVSQVAQVNKNFMVAYAAGNTANLAQAIADLRALGAQPPL
jgi:hypothetical protein